MNAIWSSSTTFRPLETEMSNVEDTCVLAVYGVDCVAAKYRVIRYNIYYNKISNYMATHLIKIMWKFYIWLEIIFSAVKRLIASKIKVLFTLYMYCVYLLCICKFTPYILKIFTCIYICILNIYLICKHIFCFLNIYMHVQIYIVFAHILYKQKLLFWMPHLTALII